MLAEYQPKTHIGYGLLILGNVTRNKDVTIHLKVLILAFMKVYHQIQSLSIIFNLPMSNV